MYKVIKFFTDLQDNNYPYEVNKPYPRKGVTVSKERIAELAGSANKLGQPLIELVKEAEKEETPAKKPAAKKTPKKPANK